MIGSSTMRVLRALMGAALFHSLAGSDGQRTILQLVTALAPPLISSVSSRQGRSAIHRSNPHSSGSRRVSSLSALRSSHNLVDSTDSKRRGCQHQPAAAVLPPPLLAAALAMTMAGNAVMMTASPLSAQAYIPSDYASETVQAAVQDLQRSAGNVDDTFKAYENVAGIITEGKGVGGMVNYQGIQLERGYVADEDTTIYNPGLTLLTESEKERLVEAVVNARKVGLSNSQWSENNEFAYEFLKGNLDPYHMVELSGYMNFVPFYAAILYAAVLAVQQFSREAFQIAYLAGVAAFLLPIVALVAAGPQ